MTAIIKQSITHLNTEVKDLKQRAAGEADAGSRQSQQHSKGVITSLQSTLKKTTADFMTVVKQRRQNVADQEERKSQFGASSVPRERPPPPARPLPPAKPQQEPPSHSCGTLSSLAKRCSWQCALTSSPPRLRRAAASAKAALTAPAASATPSNRRTSSCLCSHRTTSNSVRMTWSR